MQVDRHLNKSSDALTSSEKISETIAYQMKSDGEKSFEMVKS